MISERSRLEDLAGALIDRHGAEHALDLDFDGFPIRVRSNASGLVKRLHRYYRQFVAGADRRAIDVVAIEAEPPALDVELTPKRRDLPGKRVKEEYFDLAGGRVVRKRLTGMIFIFGSDTRLAVGPCEANDNQIINFINNQYLAWQLDRGGLLLHAAAVCNGNQGLALSGFSGMGKSTLALHLMSRGLTFVSNDRAILAAPPESPRMHGLPKLPRVNPGTILHNPSLHGLVDEPTLQAWRQMPADELWHLERKHDVFLDESFPQPDQKLSATMNGLVVLNWSHGGGPTSGETVDLDQRRDLLPAFMKSPGLFCERPGEHDSCEAAAETYVQRLAGIPIFEIRGGVDFPAATDLCQQFLG